MHTISHSEKAFNTNLFNSIDTFILNGYNTFRLNVSEVNTVKIKGNLELLAARKGMKLSQLADKAGLCRQNLSTIKRRGTCTALTAVKIAAALGVDVTEIIEDEG